MSRLGRFGSGPESVHGLQDFSTDRNRITQPEHSHAMVGLKQPAQYLMAPLT